jgi:L-ascorbate metabolism protein UlaG (beta-lactamase superfamily)
MTMLRVTWIGHSTVLLEVDGVRLVTDPVLRRRVAHLRRLANEPADDAVAAVDAALISHLHYDHLDFASLRRLGRSTVVVAPKGAGALLRRRGFHAVNELQAGEELGVGEVAVQATPAEHDGRRTRFVTRAVAVGYLVTGSARVYFAGDTDLFEGMRAIAPDLDVALLPVGGWGPRLPAGHLDSRRAAEALRLLRPRVAIPIHWGTYRGFGLGRRNDQPDDSAQRFAEHAAELAPDVDVRVLAIGERLDLPTPVQNTAAPPRETKVST